MTNLQLIEYIRLNRPTLREIRKPLGVKTVDAARERVWPLVELGYIDFDDESRLFAFGSKRRLNDSRGRSAKDRTEQSSCFTFLEQQSTLVSQGRETK